VALNAVSSGTPADTFTVTVSDGALSDTQAFTVNITPANDTPIGSSTTPVGLKEVGYNESGVAASESVISFTDAENATVEVDGSAMTTNGWSLSGSNYMKTGIYGTATFVVADNKVTYALDNDSSFTQALKAGQTEADAFTVYFQETVATSVKATKGVSFSIAGTNDAPVVTESTANVNPFTESANASSSADAIVIDGSLTVTDVDNGVKSATVQITTGLIGAEDDLLLNQADAGIAATIAKLTVDTSVDGKITFTTNDGQTVSMAEIQAVLRLVKYNNVSETPTAANRMVTFTVTDLNDVADTATRTITVTAKAERPVITPGGTGATFTENTTTVPATGDAVAVDSEHHGHRPRQQNHLGIRPDHHRLGLGPGRPGAGRLVEHRRPDGELRIDDGQADSDLGCWRHRRRDADGPPVGYLPQHEQHA